MEPARAFGESQALVRAGQRTTILFLPLHAAHRFATPDNTADHGKGHEDHVEAWTLWDRIWADSRIVFLPEPDGLEKEFRSRSRLSSPSPKVWADAYLLAFTSVSGLKLVTFDRALKARDADVLVL